MIVRVPGAAGAAIVVLAVGACTSTNVEPGPAGPCTGNADCAVGTGCVDGECVPVASCDPTSCPDGQFCDDDLTCVDRSETCVRTGGCECAIVGDGGSILDGADPVLTARPGATRRPRIVLTHASGEPIAGVPYELEVGNPALFTRW